MFRLVRLANYAYNVQPLKRLVRSSGASCNHLQDVFFQKCDPQWSMPRLAFRGIGVNIKNFHTTSIARKEGGNSGNEQGGGRNPYIPYLIGAASVAVLWMLMGGPSEGSSKTVSFKEFIEDVLPSGEVLMLKVNAYSGGHTASAMIRPGAVVRGEAVNSLFVKITGIKDVHEFERVVRDAEKRLGISPTDGIPIRVNSINTGDFIVAWAGLIIVVSLTIFMLSRLRSMFSGEVYSQIKQFSKNPSDNIATGIKFADVAGCTEAKQEVMEFVHYLKHPEKYQKLGAKMPRGCLLTGPPGVGKTLLAKAVASEAEVPFISKAGSDFVEMIGGLGARRVRDLFKEARAVAPCIVYIDELDAVGAKRSSANTAGPGGSSERDQTLNQILVEMDGLLSASHDVIIMGSTNRVDLLDKALLRPGRFDRHIGIDLPTKIERKAIFEIHLKKLKLKRPESVYLNRLTDLSPGMSGADIANICNEAAICAAREKDTHIDIEHFESAFERVLAGSKKKSSALSPEEKHIVAVREAGRTLVGWMLKHTDAIIKVSIVPRTKSNLGLTRTLPKEHRLYTQPMLKDIMSMGLAGQAAENMVFGSVTQGSEGDLKRVTDIAYAAVKQYGLSSVVGNVSFPQDGGPSIKPYSDSLSQKMDNEVRRMIYEAQGRAQDILKTNESKLSLLAKELLSKEVLNYEDIVNLIGPSPHGNKTQGLDVLSPSSTK